MQYKVEHAGQPLPANPIHPLPDIVNAVGLELLQTPISGNPLWQAE